MSANVDDCSAIGPVTLSSRSATDAALMGAVPIPGSTDQPIEPTLADFAAVPRWVAWRTEPRKAGEKPTKIPKCPHTPHNAASDAPQSWGTRAQAEIKDGRLPQSPHGPGGIGIMLGDLGDGRVLCGIDLDCCRDGVGGAIAPWAAEIMQRFVTYAEVSPSGSGIKLFFLATSAAMSELRHVLSDTPRETKNGRKWAWVGGNHAPGIEIYLTGRFFTVTDERVATAPAHIRTVSANTVTWLVREAAPRFKEGDPAAVQQLQNASFVNPYIEAGTKGDDPLMARIQSAIVANPRLAQRWNGDTAGLHDATRSGLAFALGAALKRSGFGYPEMCSLLGRNAHTATWAAEKGEVNGGREFGRIWANAGEAREVPSEPQPLFRPLAPAGTYPAEVLGRLLSDAAEAVHLRTQAPRAICAQAVLGVAAICAQPFADVWLPTGEIKPCSLFLLTIAESGERKTACDMWVLRGVRQREEQLRENYVTDRRLWQNDHDAWSKSRLDILGKAKSREAKREGLEELGPEPNAPLVPMLLVSEPTYEGLVKLYAAGHPGLGLFSGEAGTFLGGHGMTEEAKARTAAGLSDVWDGTAIKRVRGGDGAVTLPGRRLATHLMAQPAIAALLTRDQLIAGQGGQGLINRFLIAAPDTAAGTRLFREAPPEAEAVLLQFERHVVELLSLPWPGDRQVLLPRPLPLSPEARREWIAFQHSTEGSIGLGGNLETVRGLGNKLPEHAARLAAVITLFSNPEAPDISAAAMGSGIVLAQFYAGEALRLADSAQISADALLAEKVRGWLVHHWSETLVSLPDIYQHGPNAVREKARARKVVQVLEEHGHLLRVDGGAVIRGAKRRDAWQIVERVTQ